MIKIYLDNCCFNRPFDDQTQIKIHLETEEILIFAESLNQKGIKTYDALHIACAVYAKCEFYLTTDKKLLNTPIPEITIVNPIIFVNEMEG